MADTSSPIWVNITDLLWPVGSVFYTVSTTNVPASLFGGTWSSATVTDSDGTTLRRYIRTA